MSSKKVPAYGPDTSHPLAKIAKTAARKVFKELVGAKFTFKNPLCLETFGFAQLQAVKLQTAHPKWEPAGIYAIVAKRTKEYLAKEGIRSSRFVQPDEQESNGVGLFFDRSPMPDPYSAAADNVDERIIDALTENIDYVTRDNVRRAQEALGLEYQATRKRCNAFESERGWNKQPQLAKPSLLLEAQYSWLQEDRKWRPPADRPNDPRPSEYRPLRLEYFCCCDSLEVEILRLYLRGRSYGQIANATGLTSALVEDRLGRIAYRYLVM